MRYEMMLPVQIRQAISDNLPVVMACGVLEYHAEQCASGVDTVLITRMLDKLEKQIDMVVLPPFFYGCASYAVARPEHNGTVDIKSRSLLPLARDLCGSLLRIGFRNIHFIFHHQTENFNTGMPNDLVFKLASREAIFAFMENKYGEGWWGSNEMSDYYENCLKNSTSNPFEWIKLHALLDVSEPGISAYGDHAGKAETSMMMSACPQGVNMDHFKSSACWYAAGAAEASVEFGREIEDYVLKRLRKIIR